MSSNETTQHLTDAPAPAAPWIAVGALLADVVFETDCKGRFTTFGHGWALGYPSIKLIGTDAAALLAPDPEQTLDMLTQFSEIFSTICAESVSWQGNIKLLRADGSPALYRLALAPRLVAGISAGVYGMLCEVDAQPPALPESLVQHYGARGDVAPMLDLETNLWTAKIFADELARRFDRLDVEEHPGTLLYLGFCRAGASLQSAVAIRLAEELRDIVRPTDLLGRIDGTTIALWCDGMDHLTAGERAAKFCAQFPAMMLERNRITAGLSTRWPGSADDPRVVMQRAGVALRLADLATERLAPDSNAVGAWRVWQQD